MKKINYFKYILLLLTIILLNVHTKVYSDNTDKLYEKIDLFSEVLEKIENEYVDEIDQAASMDSAINGLLQSLDPYSAYMKPKDFEDSQTETSGKFGGLGIEVTMEAGVVKVITPIDDRMITLPDGTIMPYEEYKTIYTAKNKARAVVASVNTLNELKTFINKKVFWID